MRGYYTTHIAILLIAQSHKIQNGDDIVEFMKVRGMKTLKELMTGVQQLVRLLFNDNFVNPGLVL